ncbi:MAG: hypothetical protein RIS64_3505 [Bacteroidota bacterium]
MTCLISIKLKMIYNYLINNCLNANFNYSNRVGHCLNRVGHYLNRVGHYLNRVGHCLNRVG